MLLTRIEEIEACLPTSKWEGAEELLGLVEEEEEYAVVPILGRELYEHLTDRYNELLGELGDISATNAELTKEDVTDEVRLIRLCQKVQLYRAIANNSGLLSVSFNRGGGFNIATADNYDAASKDQMQRAERDAWNKAHRCVDSLLALLERDAQSEGPQFAAMWKKSRYFYLHGNLLFTTAAMMQSYIEVRDSRERYIELLPDIKYCQSVYIETEMGAELLKAFVSTATDSTVIPPYKPAEGEEVTEADMIAGNAEIRAVWDEALDRLRTALAHYVMQENEKLRRDNSLTNAELSRARALSYIREHQDAFIPYIESSPLYVKPAEAKPENEKCKIKEGYKPQAMFVLPGNLHRK